MREPRSATLTRNVTAALRAHKPLTERAFADRVVTAYQDRTALHERTVEFHTGTTADTYEQAARANAQLLKRMLTGDVRMPVDLEEAVVLALPEADRLRCLAELADRYDLLAVPKPALDGAAQHQQVSDLLREVSEAVGRLSHLLQDGRIDENDADAIPGAVAELNDVIGSASALIRTLLAYVKPAATNVHELRRQA